MLSDALKKVRMEKVNLRMSCSYMNCGLTPPAEFPSQQQQLYAVPMFSPEKFFIRANYFFNLITV